MESQIIGFFGSFPVRVDFCGDGAIQLLATGMHSAATQEAGAAGVGAKQLPKISLRSSETQLEASLIVPVLIATFYHECYPFVHLRSFQFVFWRHRT